MLRQVERYLPALEIDVFPREPVLLAPSHPCTQDDIELGLLFDEVDLSRII
jgi:hypothetical protein